MIVYNRIVYNRPGVKSPQRRCWTMSLTVQCFCDTLGHLFFNQAGHSHFNRGTGESTETETKPDTPEQNSKPYT